MRSPGKSSKIAAADVPVPAGDFDDDLVRYAGPVISECPVLSS